MQGGFEAGLGCRVGTVALCLIATLRNPLKRVERPRRLDRIGLGRSLIAWRSW